MQWKSIGSNSLNDVNPINQTIWYNSLILVCVANSFAGCVIDIVLIKELEHCVWVVI